MRHSFWAIIVLLCGLPLAAQTSIFNCNSTWSLSSGSCGVNSNSGSLPFNNNTPSGLAVNSGVLTLVGLNAGHIATALIYKTPVNVQAFAASFTFIPDGFNVAFIVEDTNNTAGGNGPSFSAGAGLEGGFYQLFSPPDPNQKFVLEFDQQSGLTNTAFSYSSAQIYQYWLSPTWNYESGTSPVKISTSPVPLNSPSGTIGATTGDTYSATMTYDGSNFALCVYDVTLGVGSCSSSTSGTGTYFQHTWTNVNIPLMVGGNTAYVGLTAGEDSSNTVALQILGMSYTVETATATPTIASTPTCSSGCGGAYPGTVTATFANPNSGTTLMCATTDTTLPTTTLIGGTSTSACGYGSTAVTGSMTITPPETVTVVAGKNAGSDSVPLVETYTSGGAATAITCTPTSGSSSSSISVSCTDSNTGTFIGCYTTNGTTPATNGSGTGCTTGTSLAGASPSITISSTTSTLKVIAGTSTLTDSTVNSYGAYTIISNISITGAGSLRGVMIQ